MKTRARKDDDKQERRQAILDAGLALWNEMSWNDFTMTAVAQRAGIVKGTVYLYFETKEQLFLALMEEQMRAYFDEVDALLGGRGRWSRMRVATAVAEPLLARPAFTRLLPLLGSILEYNVSYDRAAAFKRFTLERFTRTGALLCERLALRRVAGGVRLMMQLTALATGLAQMADPAPILAAVFDNEAELRVLRIDLRTELLHAMMTMFKGVTS
jgi:AcrR family transcriptional regulator